MGKLRTFLAASAVLAAMGSYGSWYWPFGSSDDDESRPQRVSELLAPASGYIEKASEYAEEGKLDEAIAEYEKALEELDRVETENAERAKNAEFDTLRNKRVQTRTAIDTLRMKRVMDSSRRVAITDTEKLEAEYAKMLEERRNARSGKPQGEVRDETRLVNEGVSNPGAVAAAAVAGNGGGGASAAGASAGGAPAPTRRERLVKAMERLHSKDYAGANEIIRGLLSEKPNDAASLNLRASVETAQGDYRAAEKTLDQCIQSNPRSYYAYYNLAKLILQTRGEAGAASARSYYEAGRDCGGPVDSSIEEAIQ